MQQRHAMIGRFRQLMSLVWCRIWGKCHRIFNESEGVVERTKTNKQKSILKFLKVVITHQRKTASAGSEQRRTSGLVMRREEGGDGKGPGTITVLSIKS